MDYRFSDFASYLIPQRVVFGGFPSMAQLSVLARSGVQIIVDLTEEKEKAKLFLCKYREYHSSSMIPYKEMYRLKIHNLGMNYFNFPIPDHTAPKSAVQCLSALCLLDSLYRNNKRIYIHCKGGHGRSPMICALLLSMLFRTRPSKSLEWVKQCHKHRPNMKKKWILSPCPSAMTQTYFVYSFVEKYILSTVKRNSTECITNTEEFPTKSLVITNPPPTGSLTITST